MIRKATSIQVAGTAMVVDAYVFLKVLVAESIFPLLESAGQWSALHKAFQSVEASGIRAALYAS